MDNTNPESAELDISHLLGNVISEEEAENLDKVRFKIYKALHDAIIRSDKEMVTKCTNSGISLNRHFDESINNKIIGITPLGLAAALKKIDILKILIEYGADVNLPYSSLNTTPLMTSSYHGHYDIIKLLLQYGADVHAEDIERSTAIGYAFGGSRKLEVVKLLLQARIDPNSKNSAGMDALLLAASYGSAELVEVLLRYGANPLTINYEGQNALHTLVIGKHKRILRKLKSDPSKPAEKPCTVCQWAKDYTELIGDFNAHKQDFENADDLMTFMRKEMPSPTCKNYLQAVNKYRSLRRDKASNKRKSGALDILLCGGGKSEKSSLPKKTSAPPQDKEKEEKEETSDTENGVLKGEKVLEYATVIRKLLKAGCQRDAAELKFHMTALDYALMFNDIESVSVLISAGADHALKVLAISEFYEEVKASSYDQVLDLVQSDDYLQLKKSITDNLMVPSFDHKDMGVTPLALLCGIPSASEVQGVKLKVAKAMIKKGSLVNDGGPSGRFPLTESAALGDIQMAQLLMNHGGSLEVSSRAYNGATPVLVAAMHSNTKMVQFLIEAGAKVDRSTLDGRNSLFICYENNDEETLKTLLSANLEQNFVSPDNFVAQSTRHYRSTNKDLGIVMETIQAATSKQIMFTQRAKEMISQQN